MSNNYDGMSSQINVIKTDKQTFSAYLSLKPGPDNSLEFFGKDSYLKLNIYNFASGKGDKGTNAYFNINRNDVEVLYERAKAAVAFPQVEYTFNSTKVIVSDQNRKGQGEVPCTSRKLGITRYTKMPDGKPANNPWYINIKNGEGKALPGRQFGSYYEKPNSFVLRNELFIRLSDKDFYDIIRSAKIIMDNYEELLISGKIQGMPSMAERLERIREYREQGQFSNTLDSSAEVTPDSKEAEHTSRAPEKSEKSSGRVKLVIDEEPRQETDGFHTTITASGRQFHFVFKTLSSELLNAWVQKIPIEVNAYQDPNDATIYRVDN